jgi:hypothetical protein
VKCIKLASFKFSENQGVTNLPPIGWISPLRLKQIGKDIWELCLQLIFFFPSNLFFSMITPLHLAHPVAIIPGDFFWGIQNFSSSSTVNSSRGIYSSETRKHFLSWETWKTSCMYDNCGGSSNWYATSTLCSRILNGPIYFGASFPLTLKWQSPVMGDTFRYTKSLTWKLKFLLLWSA